MGESEPNMKNSLPSVFDVRELISQNQAGFALVFLSLIFVFFAAATESSTKNLLSVGAGIAFLLGVLLIAYKEYNNHQLSFQTLKQREDDQNSKIQSLTQTVEGLQTTLEELNVTQKEQSERIQTLTADNQKKESHITQLKNEVEQASIDLNQRISEQKELSETIRNLEEQTQPEYIKKQFSTVLYNLIISSLAPENGRTTPLSVVELLELVHTDEYFLDEHFQDLILKIALFNTVDDD